MARVLINVLATTALFAAAACRSAAAPPDPRPSRAPRDFGSSGPVTKYLVLGDSTAAGVGADYEQGIAVGTAKALASRRHIEMVNLGVSGARAGDVVREQLPVAETLRPDIVLLAVGANDVTHLTPIGSIRRSALGVVEGLKKANPNVIIVITGSPDMGAPPRIPRLLRPIAAWRTASANRMFRALAAEQHLVFAPIAEETGPLFRQDHTLFAADRFHPNDRGYATWLAVLNRQFNEAVP